jgi:hypothetical protein
MGWDNSDNPNGYAKATGQVAYTPTETFSITTSFHVGPEQLRSQMHGHANQRWIVDTAIVYTGVDKLTLAVNFDFAGEQNDPALVAIATRAHDNSSWGGMAGYIAYEWTKALRSALRLEYFADPQGVRNGITAPGHNVDFYELTATVEYKIWRGLVGRLEYRHDQSSQKAFSLTNHGVTPTSRAQNTMSFDVYYAFF